MRPRILTGSCCAALVLAGCGGGDGAAALQNPERVRLEVTAPPDGALVEGATVDVRGRVSPERAQVRVLGRPALVTGGRFTVVIPLEPGTNVVDVAASAGGRTPAFAALRVRRDVSVSVPDLAGVPEEQVESLLGPLDLLASVRRGGGILDGLRSGPRVVCDQQPGAGSRVRRGRTVRVLVAKRCPQ